MNSGSYLLDRILSRKANLAVIGLGHVGLPTALIFARAGFDVTGIDSDLRNVEALKKGKCDLREAGLQEILTACLRSGTFHVTNELNTARSDFAIVCVPTPVVNGVPDLENFRTAFGTVKAGAHQNTMVLVESTVPPSTTHKFATIELQSLNYRIDEEIFLAYCPERLTPGRALEELVNNTRIIGGVGPRSSEIAANLYKTICKNVVVTDSLTAEISKLAENTFRDLNIAYANLLALISEHFGADANEVIKLANTHPRVRIHTPGLGAGGPCLPKDPYILIYGFPEELAQLVKLGRNLNQYMVGHAISVVTRALACNGVDIRNARVAVLGVSYKPETEDVTNASAEPLIKGLVRRGASVVTYDPCTRETFGAERASSQEEALKEADCVIIVTAHATFKSIDPSKLRQLTTRGCVVFDGPRVLDPIRAESYGLTYRGTGYGRRGQMLV
jgi:UDP-N-acetyl-D-mannosaminuronic acid dehydrogenase